MHIRCPHCRNPVEYVDDGSLSDVQCPSCGSNFSLVQTDATETYRADVIETLGHFQLGERLGIGAFGTVWMAIDTELDRTVAVKVPRKGQLSEKETEQFLREARAAAQLKHPGIVSVHEVGREGDSVYIVSELIEGLTLTDWLTGQQPTPREAAELCAKIAAALDHAHQQGVIHRDLKPGNIMLDRDNEPHIMDFGLAKREAGEITMTMDGQILGTPAYMSPEQARGESRNVDRRADIYSLGVILFELLTGERPFRGNKQMLLHQLLTEEAPAPGRLNATIPRDLETICLKCLQKDPQRRYATAGELHQDLDSFLAGKPILARPVGRTEKVWRWCRRNPALAGTTGLAATALVATAIIGIVFAVTQTRMAEQLREEQGNTLDALEDVREQVAISDSRAEQLAHQLAASYLDRGLQLCEQGEVGHGLLWLSRSLEQAPADSAPLQRAARLNLAAWSIEIPQLQCAPLDHSSTYRVAYNPDGTVVAVTTGQGSVHLWDAETGKQLGAPLVQVVDGHNVLTQLVFSLDGTKVAAGGTGGSVVVWDVETRQPVAGPLEHSEAITGISFSPDGTLIATASTDDTAGVWDVVTGEPVTQPLQHESFVYGIAFSSDGARIATGSFDATAQLWDARTGQPIGPPLRHGAGVNGVAFCDEGRILVTAADEGTVRTWDGMTGKSLGAMVHDTEGVRGLAASPDGMAVATSHQDGTVRLWDPATRRAIGSPMHHARVVASVAFSADGRLLLTGSYDRTAQLWDARTGTAIGARISHPGIVRSGAFHPDGRSFATSCTDGKARIWSLDGALQPRQLPLDSLNSPVAVLRADGQAALTCADRVARVWDCNTGRLVVAPMEHGQSIFGATFSADGRLIATAGFDDTARIRDASTGRPLGAPLVHPDGVVAVAFNTDATLLVTGCLDGAGRLWRVATGELIGTPMRHTAAVHHVAFSPDGTTILTVGDDHAARLWSAATTDSLGPPMRHGIRATLNSEGTFVLTGGEDGTTRLWDAETCESIAHFPTHQNAINDVAFGADGSRFVTGSADGTARIWNTADGTPVSVPLRHAGSAWVVAVSPDGSLILCGSENAAVVWDAETAIRIGPSMNYDGVPEAVSFSSDGNRTLIATESGSWLRSLAGPAQGDAEHLALWTQVITGFELDDTNAVRSLDADEWEDRRSRLAELGGVPAIDWRPFDQDEAGWQPDWNDDPIDSFPATPDDLLAETFSQHQGMLTERFAMCQTMPFDTFQEVVEQLRPSGYRPLRVRPYSSGDDLLTASVWTRDHTDWQLLADATSDMIHSKHEELRAMGYVPCELAGYLLDEERYVGIWVRDDSAVRDVRVEAGVTTRTRSQTSSELQEDGYFIASLQTFVASGEGAHFRHNVIWWKASTSAPHGEPNLAAGPTVARGIEAAIRSHAATPIDAQFDVTVCQHLDPDNNDAVYGACWFHAPHLESAELHGLSPTSHVFRARRLASDGYRPVAIGACTLDDNTRVVTASVWHRPRVWTRRPTADSP